MKIANIVLNRPYFYWLDDETFLMGDDGHVDEDGDEYHYEFEHHLDEDTYTFARVFDYESLDLTDEQEERIIKIMTEAERMRLREEGAS